MPLGDKSIKISVVVDERSLARAKEALSGVTREVSKLVEMTSKLGGSGGGMARVGAMAGVAGGGSGGTQATHQMAGAAGGMASGLTRAVTDTANIFRGAAEGSRKALKTMQEGLRGLADDGDKTVVRLERSFAKLPPLLAAANAITQRQKFEALQAAGIAETGRMGGGGKPGFIGGTLNKLQDSVNKGDIMGGLRALLPVGGAAALALGAVNFGISAYNANDVANRRYGINEPMFGSNLAAQTGQTFGGNAAALRHGDIARVWAMREIAKESNTSKIVSEQAKQARAKEITLATPVSLREHIRTEGLFSGAKNYFGAHVGSEINNLTQGNVRAGLLGRPGSFLGNLFGSKNSEGAERIDVLARETMQASEAGNQMVMAQQRLQNKLASDPMFAERMNNFYGGSMGDLGLARAGGFGGGFGKDRKTGRLIDSVAEFNAGASRMFISGGERAGLRQTMGATAGRGFFGHGDSLLGPQAGGLSNAASIFGVGGQFSSGGNWAGASKFMRGIQGGIGRGGVDVTAGAQVAGTGMAAMTSGNFQGTSGSGLMSSLLDATYSGSTGGDMRNARVVAAGMGANDQMMSGGIDPAQKAFNFSAALGVGKNLPWSTRLALTKLDTASALDIVRTGKVPASLAAHGVTTDMVRQYVGNQDKTALARVVSGTLTSEQRGALSAYRSAGGLGYISPKASRKEKLNQLHLISSMLEDTTGAGPEAAFGRVRLQAVRMGLLKGDRGAGAHDPVSRKSARAAVARDQAAETSDIGTENATDEGNIREFVSGRKGQQKAYESERRAAQAGGDSTTMSGAINNIQAALQNFVSLLKNEVGPAPRRGPPVGSGG